MAVYPTDALAGQMSQMNMQPVPRAGESALIALFGEGNILMLQSAVTGQNIRVFEGEMYGTGDNGPFSRFKVFLRDQGKVVLQSEANQLDHLAIYEGTTIGTGRGGPFCEFRVIESGDGYVYIESTQYPGQRIGFFPDGRVKPPAEVTTDADGKFKPIVHQFAPGPQQSMQPPPGGYQQVPPGGYQQPPPGGYQQPPPGGYQQPPPGGYQQPPPGGYQQPPPGAYGYQQPPPGAYGYQQPPPGSYAPGYGQPSQGSMMPPPQGSVMPGAPLPQATLAPGIVSEYPIGFDVKDAFRDGNVLQLIAKINGNPVCFDKGNLSANGSFSKTISFWKVSIDSSQGVMFTNHEWSGVTIAIKGKSITTVSGSTNKHCAFKVNVLPDNYVTLEAVEKKDGKDGYLYFQSNGAAGSKPREINSTEEGAHFFVRLESQKSPFSYQVGALGRPSIIYPHVVDRSVLQFFIYDEATKQERLLSIDIKGNVKTITNGNDDTSFFIWKDRGMGIVSLQSHKFPHFRLRMTNFVVTAKGEPDINGDFRVVENSDNTISFESVSCGGAKLGIANSKNKSVSNFYVYLVSIQKFGKSNTITKRRII